MESAVVGQSLASLCGLPRPMAQECRSEVGTATSGPRAQGVGGTLALAPNALANAAVGCVFYVSAGNKSLHTYTKEQDGSREGIMPGNH